MGHLWTRRLAELTGLVLVALCGVLAWIRQGSW